MKPVGRFLVRGAKVAGIFCPVGDTLKPGIYEITEVLGELIVTNIGQPAMPKARVNGLDLSGLHAERDLALMTSEEWNYVNQDK